MKPARQAVRAARRARKGVARSVRSARRKLLRLTLPTMSRGEFLSDVERAVATGTGYAAGKNGRSEQYWMYYPILLERETDERRITEYESDLSFHGLRNTGIFPADPDYYLEYTRFYVRHVRNLDCLGVFYYLREPEIIEFHDLEHVPLIHYVEHEPERSVPSDPGNCYLPFFEGKKMLIVCPFAGFLAERANQETFESVWSKTGKKWFHPESVEALEFPYGFEPGTHERYETAVDLYDDITSELDRRDFDVALIGAAGLAVPLASYVKDMGKIGIDLGGHLQIVFGVYGERWADREDWQEKYFNEAWTRLPEAYTPSRQDVCDRGAYW